MERTEAQHEPGGAAFQTTHWSLVLAAGDGDSTQARAALEWLCRAYWHPVYAFVRRRGYRPEDAQDLTQGFFEHLLSRGAFGLIDPARGRFRAFLLTALRNFLVTAWEHARTQRRGGAAWTVPFDEYRDWEKALFETSANVSPDVLYDRSWAWSLLTRSCGRLREEYAGDGRFERFRLLEQFLPTGTGNLTYAELAGRFGQTEAAIRSEIHRFRLRFRSLLRREVAHTVSVPEEIDDEIRYLMEVVSASP